MASFRISLPGCQTPSSSSSSSSSPSRVASMLFRTRARRSVFVLLVLLLLCFMLAVNVALQDIAATTVALEALHDPSSVPNPNPSPIPKPRPSTPPTPSTPSTTSPPGTNETNSNGTAPARRRPRILLVSAMFPLAKSKHTKEEYAYWISQFLQPITTDVYFFTPASFAATVQGVRPPAARITVDTTYSSPFDIPPLRGREEKYRAMHALDREAFRHSPELYAVWNAKPFFVDAAVRAMREKARKKGNGKEEEHGSEYDYVFWNDAGSFRGYHLYKDWPDAGRVAQVWETGERITGTPREKLLFFPLAGMPAGKMRYWREEMGPVDYDVSEGSFFGGSPETMSWWKDVYYTYHDYYLSRGMFVGKDQTLINALLLLFPARVIGVWFGDPDAPARAGLIPHFDQSALGACGSEWYYSQFWLADAQTRERMRDVWVGWTEWKGWEWWKKRQRCRLTGVLALEDVWKRQFGEKWSPPSRSVPVRTF